MTKKIFILFILLIFSLTEYGQIVRYSNDYLNIGTSARNISLGNSVVSSVNTCNSGYYNSAGLSRLNNKYDFSLMHSEYFAGIAKYDYAGFAYKVDEQMGVAVSLIRLGIDDIQNTLYLIDDNGNVDYDRIELFSVADYAMFVSIGKKSKIQGLSYGGSAKLIYRSQGEFAKAYGFGIDLGAQFKYDKWLFGANFTNATTSFTAWFYNIDEHTQEVFQNTGNEIPHNSIELTMPQLTLGAGRYFIFSDKTGLRSELDLLFTFDGKRNALISFNPVSLYPQMGFEFDYSKTLFVRVGVNNFQLIPDFMRNAKEDDVYFKDKSLDFVPAIGLGIVFHGFKLDYALTDVGNLGISLYSHISSISYSF
jgi:hypothetical protein